MKATTQTFVFWLPLMVMLTLVGWTVFGALPGATMTGDLIAWLLELPVVTCYALASVASAALIKRVFLREIDSTEEEALHRRVLDGVTTDRNTLNSDIDNAKWLLKKDRVEWFALLILCGLFFFPHWG